MLLLTRDWTSADRTPNTNLRLGQVLAFVVGAANAGGFLAVGQYTSHMTGIVPAWPTTCSSGASHWWPRDCWPGC